MVDDSEKEANSIYQEKSKRTVQKVCEKEKIKVE
jgi:hypothetical protein